MINSTTNRWLPNEAACTRSVMNCSAKMIAESNRVQTGFAKTIGLRILAPTIALTTPLAALADSVRFAVRAPLSSLHALSNGKFKKALFCLVRDLSYSARCLSFTVAAIAYAAIGLIPGTNFLAYMNPGLSKPRTTKATLQHEISTLKQKIKTLTEEKKQLLETCTKLNNEKNALLNPPERNKILALEETLRITEARLKALEGQNNQFIKENTILIDLNKNLSDTAQTMQSQLEKLRNDIETKKMQVLNQSGDLKKLESEKQSLQNQLAKLSNDKQKLEEANKAIEKDRSESEKKFKDQMETLKQKLEQSVNEEADARTRLELLQTEKLSLEQRYGALSQEKLKLEKELKEKIESSEQSESLFSIQIKDLKDALQISTADLETQKNLLEKAIQEKDALSKKNESEKNALSEDILSEIQNKEREIGELNSAIDELNEKITNLTTSLNEARSGKENLQSENATKQKQIEHLQTKIVELQKELDVNIQNLNTEKMDAVKLKAEMMDLRQALEVKQKEIEDLNSDKINAKNAIESLQDNVKDLCKKDGEIQQLKQSLEKKELEIEDLKNNMQSAKKDLDETNSDYEELIKLHTEQENCLKAKHEEIQNILQEKQNIENTLLLLREELQKKSNQLKENESALAEAKEKLQVIEKNLEEKNKEIHDFEQKNLSLEQSNNDKAEQILALNQSNETLQKKLSDFSEVALTQNHNIEGVLANYKGSLSPILWNEIQQEIKKVQDHTLKIRADLPADSEIDFEEIDFYPTPKVSVETLTNYLKKIGMDAEIEGLPPLKFASRQIINGWRFINLLQKGYSETEILEDIANTNDTRVGKQRVARAFSWYLTYLALDQDKPLDQGTFTLFDQDHKIANFFMKDGADQRLSSHFKEIKKGSDYGIDTQNLPGFKRTILFGKISLNPKKEQSYFKMEDWEVAKITEPSTYFGGLMHLVDFVRTRPLFKNWKFSKSVIPEMTFKEHTDPEIMIKFYTLAAELKKEYNAATIVGRGIAGIAEYLQDWLPEKNEQLNEDEMKDADKILTFWKALEEKYGPQVYFRKGNEILIEDFHKPSDSIFNSQ